MFITLCMTATIQGSSPIVLGTRSPGFSTPLRHMPSLVAPSLCVRHLNSSAGGTSFGACGQLGALDTHRLPRPVPLTTNDAPGIPKYGSLVRPNAQIVALRAHGAKCAPIVDLAVVDKLLHVQQRPIVEE